MPAVPCSCGQRPGEHGWGWCLMSSPGQGAQMLLLVPLQGGQWGLGLAAVQGMIIV